MAASRKTKSKKASSKKRDSKKTGKKAAAPSAKTAKTVKTVKAGKRPAARKKPSDSKTTAKKMTQTKRPAKAKSVKAKPVKAKTATAMAVKAKPVKPNTVKPRKKATTVPPKAKKPAKRKKPAVDPELLRTIREALVRQRNQLMSLVQSTQAQMAEKAGDFADVSDRASGGFEDELALGLMKIEAAQIDDIEAAIKRIDDDTYGLCADCGKLIPRKRLEVLPFAQRCLNCEGTRERRARIQTHDED